MPKIPIPRKEDQILNLMIRIQAYHDAHSRQSLLNAAFNMERLRHKTQNIQNLKSHLPNDREEAQRINRLRRRDLRFISREIKGIRNLLQSVYPDDHRVFQQWGFDI